MKYFHLISAIASQSLLARNDLSNVHTMKAEANGGKWENSGLSGVTCIHTALLPDSKLLCMERPHMDPYPENPNTNGLLSTQIDLKGTVNADGTWTAKPTAISITNNPFCAGHAQLANGVILVAGGDNQSTPAVGVVNGRKGLRTFTPCAPGSDSSCLGTWDIKPEMSTERWYPTVVTLPDSSAIIIGGQTKNIDFENLKPTDDNPTYQYYPAKTSGTWPRRLDILAWAFPHNLYPQSFLLPSGRIFMLVSNRSIILDPKDESITNLPDLVADDHAPWIYPHTPTMFVLPMTIANNFKFELMICGGNKQSSSAASASCFKINPDDSNPSWTKMPDMPNARLMPDAVILPDGKILIVNGMSAGQAGGNQGQTQFASGPVFATDMFDPVSSKWSSLNPAKNIRSYHSEALLLEDGYVVTTGSEMNNYNDYWPTRKPGCFKNTDVFVATSPVLGTGCTDPFNYNIERFSPPYMAGSRPVLSKAPATTTHGSLIQLDMDSTDNYAMVSFIRTSTVTHSTNTDQRFIELKVTAASSKSLFVRIPDNTAQAPVGNWFVFVVDKNGVPSVGKTISLGLGPATEVTIPSDAQPKKNGDFRIGFGALIMVGLLALL